MRRHFCSQKGLRPHNHLRHLNISVTKIVSTTQYVYTIQNDFASRNVPLTSFLSDRFCIPNILRLKENMNMHRVPFWRLFNDLQRKIGTKVFFRYIIRPRKTCECSDCQWFNYPVLNLHCASGSIENLALPIMLLENE